MSSVRSGSHLHLVIDPRPVSYLEHCVILAKHLCLIFPIYLFTWSYILLLFSVYILRYHGLQCISLLKNDVKMSLKMLCDFVAFRLLTGLVISDVKMSLKMLSDFVCFCFENNFV